MAIGSMLKENNIYCHFLIHRTLGQAIATHLDKMSLPYTRLSLGTIWSLRLALREPVRLIHNLVSIILSPIEFAILAHKLKPTHLLTGNATFSFYILPVLLLLKIRVVYRHGDLLACHSFFHRWLNSVLFERVDINVANCIYLINHLKEKISIPQIAVIYNYPPRVGLTQSLLTVKKQTNGIVLLYVGRLSKQKGFYELLEAFRKIADKYPLAVLHVVGDIENSSAEGLEYKSTVLLDLEKFYTQFPKRVIYHGSVDDPTLFYDLADIHVCPSIYGEVASNVIFEAKAHGVPSVIFKVGGLPELIDHQRNGFICREINAAALAEGLEYFLSNPTARHAAGAAARESLQTRFGIECFTQQWLAVLAMPEASPE